MKLNVDLISQLMVYGGLFLICSYILWIGPITEVLKNDTRFVESFQNIDDLSEPIEWPDLMICKSPMTKNKEKHEDLIENPEKNASLSDVFYIAEDLINAIVVAKVYETGLWRGGAIKIQPPTVITTLIDFKYFGQCAQISLQEVKEYLIQTGEMQKDDIDGGFVASIVLKVSIYLLSRYHPRFFDQFGHDTMCASSENKHFFTE